MKKSLIFVILLLALPFSSASSQQRLVAQLDTDSDWGCVLSEDGNTLERKGKLGVTSELELKKGLRKINRRRSKILKKVSTLQDFSSLTKKQKSKLRKFRKNAKKANKLRKAIHKCRNSTIETPSPDQRTFAFTCEHAFKFPAYADGDNSCGLNLLQLKKSGRSFSKVSLAAAIRIIDKSLLEECENDGGTYYRPTDLRPFLPLYHGVCHMGEEELTSSNRPSIDVFRGELNMETVNEDCFGPVPAPGVEDPCDGYDPDAPRGGGGTTTDDDKKETPEEEEDCFILAMETVNEDC